MTGKSDTGDPRAPSGAERGTLTAADYALTLAPWVGYIVLTTVLGSWKYGFIAGMGVAAGIVAWRVIQHQSRFMDLGTLVFCACMAGAALYNAKSFLKTYNLPLSIGFVGILAGASLLIRSPFTYRCHRDHLPETVVTTPELHDVVYKHHVNATACWAICEIIAGGISALLILHHMGGGAVAFQILGTAIPTVFTQSTHHRLSHHPKLAHLLTPAGHTVAAGTVPA